MAWTYDDPSSSDKDAVRFEIQDTDSSAPLLQDEEIAYALNVEAGVSLLPRSQAGVLRGAARCCEVLARRFAMQADTEVGSLKTAYSVTAVNYGAQAKALRARAQGQAAPYAGGLSVSEKVAAGQDPDRIAPRFGRDDFTNPWRGRTEGWPPDGDLIWDR